MDSDILYIRKLHVRRPDYSLRDIVESLKLRDITTTRSNVAKILRGELYADIK